MTLEVGTSVQKVLAMAIAGIGAMLLLQSGETGAAIAIFTGIGVYAIGEANGKRLEQKNSKGRIQITSEFTKEELIEFAQKGSAGHEPEELPLHRL